MLDTAVFGNDQNGGTFVTKPGSFMGCKWFSEASGAPTHAPTDAPTDAPTK